MCFNVMMFFLRWFSERCLLAHGGVKLGQYVLGAACSHISAAAGNGHCHHVSVTGENSSNRAQLTLRALYSSQWVYRGDLQSELCIVCEAVTRAARQLITQGSTDTRSDSVVAILAIHRDGCAILGVANGRDYQRGR
jgi:hypothetical protein